MRGSIRSTLTFWYIGILALILVLFGGVLCFSVARSLARDLDKTLALQADGVASTLFAFREAEQSALGQGAGNWKTAPALTFPGEIQRGQLPELVSRWARKTNNLETGRLIRLIDRYGRPLAASASFSQLELPVSRKAVREALEKRTSYETVRRPGQRNRLITRPVIEQGRVLYVVQVAGSLSLVDASVKRVLFGLVVLIPLTLLLASSGGWFLATTALKPVDSMISQAQHISTKQLEERIPIPEADDELKRLAVTFNEMLGRLEKGFRQLRQFSAAASHELRTPLTVIRGELELALRRVRTPEEYQRVLAVHLEKADEMIAIIEELLAFAYNEAVDRAVEWKPIDLVALARQASELWRTVASGKSVRIEMALCEPVWIRGEQRLLERLVANLLDNAVNHTPPQGRVTLSVNLQGQGACLSVQDTGSGIPLDQLHQIFDQFFKQRSPTNNDETASTGLGLGLCRWIVELHRGHLDVTSPPGQGATFTVWLPVLLSKT